MKTQAARPIRTSDASPAPTGLILTTTVVVKETAHIPAALGEGGVSVGQFIDEHLANMAQAGNVVQTLTLDIEPELWEGYAQRAESERRGHEYRA